jgi:hypothetical protein
MARETSFAAHRLVKANPAGAGCDAPNAKQPVIWIYGTGRKFSVQSVLDRNLYAKHTDGHENG